MDGLSFPCVEKARLFPPGCDWIPERNRAACSDFRSGLQPSTRGAIVTSLLASGCLPFPGHVYTRAEDHSEVSRATLRV